MIGHTRLADLQTAAVKLRDAPAWHAEQSAGKGEVVKTEGGAEGSAHIRLQERGTDESDLRQGERSLSAGDPFCRCLLHSAWGRRSEKKEA